VELDNELQRPSDIMCSKGDARKAYAELEWKSSYTMPDVVRMMVQNEFNQGEAARQQIALTDNHCGHELASRVG
jgi:GDP-D-mannose dehydratase